MFLFIAFHSFLHKSYPEFFKKDPTFTSAALFSDFGKGWKMGKESWDIRNLSFCIEPTKAMLMCSVSSEKDL